LSNRRRKNTYSSYLAIKTLLSAQHLQTNRHDELLFITIHQSHELWFKLAIHELDHAIELLMRDHAGERDCVLAYKVLCRVNEIQRLITASWSVLTSLTPDEFLVFRETVGKDGASGFQSVQYRILEYKLGSKYSSINIDSGNGKRTVNVSTLADNSTDKSRLSAAMKLPSIYDAVLKYISTNFAMFNVQRTSADYSRPYQKKKPVLEAWFHVYQDREHAAELYQLAEKLIDIEDALRRWRFIHLATVSRIIGRNSGTGGSTGLRYLQGVATKSFDEPLYPELWDVRNRMFNGGTFDPTAAGYSV
jgi:tryptophan 2,3-dioxygenase